MEPEDWLREVIEKLNDWRRTKCMNCCPGTSRL
ncbi:hypothetical protein [Shigella flexneri]